MDNEKTCLGFMDDSSKYLTEVFEELYGKACALKNKGAIKRYGSILDTLYEQSEEVVPVKKLGGKKNGKRK